MARPLRLQRWTPRIAQHHSLVRLNRIKIALIEIAGLWGDVNNGVVLECDRLGEELTALQDSIAEATEYELTGRGAEDA